ncbi:MAG: hypothetical protein CME65_14740 [Halobacteriovoraceae bacterium]|nr:hypothetical protein [Halobacteriovoraceae bacterium]|tara:strand:- start:8099 stop:8719 length:621 start_codon:yes stop_codon:yes gene_type:complete
MKKIACLCLLSSSIVFAQENTSMTQSNSDMENSLIFSVFGVASETEKEVRNEVDRSEYDKGYGLFVEGNFNDHFGVETGAYIIKRQYEVSNRFGSITTSVDRLTVPVLAKFWLADFFSVGIGPYASFSIGDERTDVNLAGINIASSESKASEDQEIGLETSATFNLAVNDKTGVFAEGRYSRPFDNEANDQFVNHVSLLAGLKVDL